MFEWWRAKSETNVPSGDLPRAPDILKMRIVLGLIVGVLSLALLFVIRRDWYFGLPVMLLAYICFRHAWRAWRLLPR